MRPQAGREQNDEFSWKRQGWSGTYFVMRINLRDNGERMCLEFARQSRAWQNDGGSERLSEQNRNQARHERTWQDDERWETFKILFTTKVMRDAQSDNTMPA